MFSCIYSPTDNSLTVIGKLDKKLKLLGEWKSHEKAEMKWGKKIYQGTIIQIGDNEDELTTFANAANRKVLPGANGKGEDEILKELYRFSLKKSEQESGKRKHIETDRLKQSRLQELESPNKKKKGSTTITKHVTKGKATTKKEKDTTITPAQKKTLKKRKEEATELIVASEISELSKQFGTNDGSQHRDVSVDNLAEEINDDVPPPSDDILSEQVEVNETAQSQTVQCTEKEETQKNMRNLLTEKNDVSLTVNNNHQETLLTATWQLCQKAEESQESQNNLPSEVDAPPLEVIQLFSLLLNPVVQQYMKKMVDRFRNASQIQPQSSPVYMNLDGDNIYDSNLCGEAQFSQFLNHGYQPSISDMQPTSTASSSNLHYSVQAPQYIQQRYIETVQPSPIRQPQSPQRFTQKPATSNFQYGTQDTSQETIYPETPQNLRRSPRKASTSTPTSGSKSTTKLLANRTIVIDKDVLALAIRLSKKSAKPAYTLAMKLMPGLFSNEEMAQSKGQGLVIKKDDLRPVLDKERISALKEYVRCWCKTNNIPEPGETEMNEAITERISYARKLVKKKLFNTKAI